MELSEQATDAATAFRYSERGQAIRRTFEDQPMKRLSRMPFALAIATLLSLPAFAAEDLCSLNLQQLEDNLASGDPLGEPLRQQVEELQAKAEHARDAGDLETCTALSEQALQLLQAPGEEGAGY